MINEVVFVVLIIYSIIMTCVALAINISWLKHCRKLNDEWYYIAKRSNSEWRELAYSINDSWVNAIHKMYNDMEVEE